MNLRMTVTTLAAVLFVTATASAATYVVKPDGTGDYATIQAAIHAAADGDEVVLTDGVFVGDGNYDIDPLGKGITIRSESGDPETCTIDAGFQDRVFHVHSGEYFDTVIEGVTIRYGDAGDGGGLTCNSSSPTVRNCVFYSNQADNEGGGIFAEYSAMIVEECEFRSNSGQFGAGFYLRNSPNLIIRNCGFYENISSDLGGGLMIKNSAAPTLETCEFGGNVADRGGGIVVWEGNSGPEIRECVFFENSADYGGGLFVKDAQPIVESCTFADNDGPGGGGIFCWTGATTTVHHTIVAFSTAGSAVGCGSGGVAALSCCDVFGNAGGDYVGCIGNQGGLNGNFSEHPAFCDPGNGNYRLNSDSPCVNAPGCGLVGALGVGCNAGPLELDAYNPACPIPEVRAGEAYPPGTVFHAYGGVPSYTWSQTGLPQGLDIHSTTGEIVGAATESGYFVFTVTVTDQQFDTAERACSLSVIPALFVHPTVPPCPIPTAARGEEYLPDVVFAAQGGVPPYAWSQTGLPPGLDIDPVSGAVDGTPTEPGSFDFTVSVTDAEQGTADRECSIDVEDPVYLFELKDGITARGLDVDIPIGYYSDAPLKAYSLAVLFDPDVFEVRPGIIDTAGTATVGAEIVAFSASDSTARVAVVYSYDCPPRIEPGGDDLARLLLRVKETAPIGRTVITFTDVPPTYNRMSTCDGRSIAPELNPNYKGEFDVQYGMFVRGDVNGDSLLTIEDPMRNIAYQIGLETVHCLDAADSDGNGEVNITDPAWSLSYQFGSGDPPVEPFPACGLDPQWDSLDCLCSPACTDCEPPAGGPPLPAEAPVVRIALGEGAPYGENRLRYPVFLETDGDLSAWEYAADFGGSNLEYDFLDAGGWAFASGRLDSATGAVRFGQVVSFGLSEFLPPGIHEIGGIVCAAPGGSIRPFTLAGGIYVGANGESGPIEVGTATGVPSAGEAAPPGRFHTYARPNPFNPAVTIHYEIPEKSRTTIGIYDTRGRLVRELVDEATPAGNHEVVWNGRNRSGLPVASGVYFYIVRTDERRRAEKIVLLK